MQSFAAGAGSASAHVRWDLLCRKTLDSHRLRSQGSASNAVAASRNAPARHSILTIPVLFTIRKNWKICTPGSAANQICIYKRGRLIFCKSDNMNIDKMQFHVAFSAENNMNPCKMSVHVARACTSSREYNIKPEIVPVHVVFQTKIAESTT